MMKYVICLLVMLVAFNASAASSEYESCFNKAVDDNAVALCMKAETARLLRETQQVYQNLAKDRIAAKWNNGNGLINGNLKDMYNSWLAYRNRYCSLFEAVSVNMPGSSAYDRERCLLNLTNEHYDLVKSAMVNAVSGGEEDDD